MDGRLTAIEAGLLELSRTQHQHTASIEHNTNSIAGLEERVTAEIVAIRSDNDHAFAAMRAEIGHACVQARAAAVAPVADHDTCEVRVSGIPLSVDVTSNATAERIVSALELNRLLPHILSVREWAPRRRMPVAAPSAGNVALDLEMKTMVIRFSSANAHETFLAATPKFQRLSMRTIFGIADDGRANRLRANVILPPDRHRLYRRLKRKGGGVGLYSSSCFKVSVIFTSDQRYLNRPEYAVYSITHQSIKLLVAVVYRRPKAAYPFTFFDTISEILHQFKNVLILGDFNVDISKYRNRHARYMRNLIGAYNLHLVSNSPTHQVSYTNGSHHISCLDLIITDNLTTINNFTISDTPFAAGHHFISFALNITPPIIQPKTLLLKRIGVTAKRSPSPLTYFSPETLWQHFARVSSASPPLTSEIVKNLLSVPLPRTTPCFSFERVTAADVLSAMAKCTSSSSGPDGIPLTVLKLASPTLAEHIANLANSSFETGTFPSAWKFSSVVALSKCSTPSSPSDTRPISLLPELSKIVERLAHAKLSTHLS
ncbi:hypothetical protein TKK_0002987 [Trichogramma kaykai]